VWNRRKYGWLGGVFVFSLVVLLFLTLGVVRLSVSGVVRFLIGFLYKPDHFSFFLMNSQSSWRLR
jgi:hypothetical protein